MKIVNMKNYKVNNSKQYVGFAIMDSEGKFLSLDGKAIYIPCGGRKALKTLLPIANTFEFVALH